MSDQRKHAGLSTEMLVDAALRILNTDGLKSLTTRRLAREHDVQHPALYHHFASKEILLGHVSARLLQMSLDETPRGGNWRTWLRDFSVTTRKVLLRYRDGAAIVARSVPVPRTETVIVPTICAPMRMAGISQAESNAIYCCVSSFTLGWVVNEQNTAKYAMMSAMTDIEATFARGIVALIDGLGPRTRADCGGRVQDIVTATQARRRSAASLHRAEKLRDAALNPRKAREDD